MTRQSKQDAERREAELARKFGERALPGQTEREQRELYCGAVMATIFHGVPICSSLADTAKTGGC